MLRLEHQDSSSVSSLNYFNIQEVLDSVEVYEESASQWRMYEFTLLEKRSGVSAVVLDKKIYILGGYDGINRLKSVECFSPGNVRPIRHLVPDMLRRRSNFAVSVLDGKIYVSGRSICLINGRSP